MRTLSRTTQLLVDRENEIEAVPRTSTGLKVRSPQLSTRPQLILIPVGTTMTNDPRPNPLQLPNVLRRRSIGHYDATAKQLALCAGQLSGSRADGRPPKSELVLAEEYVLAPVSGVLLHSPQPHLCNLFPSQPATGSPPFPGMSHPRRYNRNHLQFGGIRFLDYGNEPWG